MCVLLRRAQADLADRITPGSRVRWGRDEGIGENTYLLAWDSGATWYSVFGHEPPNDSLALWLPVLWSLTEYTPVFANYFRGECQPAVTETPEAGPVQVPEVDATPEQKARWERAARESKASRKDASTLGDTFPRLGTPGSNGKHG